jgi:hypothetical protein
MNATVRFGHFGAALEDQSLRSVERRKVGSPTSGFREFETCDRARFSERLSRFVQILRGFRSHRSTPSRRISCISGVRSR